MLSGFNTNVRHRGLLLHVQTEDSGRANPRVITHLFHGGTILASEKLEYADRLEAEDLTKEVRGLMERQHRAMLRRLKRGELDAQLAERLGSEALAAEPEERTGSGLATPEEPEPAVELEPAIELEPAVEPAPEPATPLAAAAEPGAEAGERPLDEVVLEYLVERSRKRRRPGR